MTAPLSQTDCETKSSDELEDSFLFFWSGCIRTFQLDSVEYSPSNKDFDMSWREKYDCAPKLLGFVYPEPMYPLTPAGIALAESKRPEEVFLRQLLKFQVPSPYHKPSAKAANFCIKPYLEMIRLVRTLGTLKFDELQIFGMQMTDWHDFDLIVKKIEKFRIEKLANKGNYKKFKSDYAVTELREIYKDNLESGETKTRESADKSEEKFLQTKLSNMRDYTDACFRYLRSTGLVNVSHVGKSLSIVPERIDEVDYILETIDREPATFKTEKEYAEYLGNAQTPTLFTDNKEKLIDKLRKEFSATTFNESDDLERLKDLLGDLVERRKNDILTEQVSEIKGYKQYDDIQNTFELIKKNNMYDAPLILEWNTWRAMTMLDGGDIKANLRFDDFGKPLSTALGNSADIVCDYGDFILSVEVTLSNGYKQYGTMSGSVCNHLGQLKNTSGKPCYCLFIAPNINDSCVAHFYGLHSLNISYYGGKSVIVPLPLDVFQKMLEDSFKAAYTPNPAQVRRFFEYSEEMVKSCADEKEWYEKMKKEAANWVH